MPVVIRARDEGVRVLEATTLADNHAAPVPLRGLGFRVCSFGRGLVDLRSARDLLLAA